MSSEVGRELDLHRREDHWLARFSAMASPCEVLIDCERKSEAEELASLAILEARRIEAKFSRYRTNNIIHAINQSNGARVALDEETYGLLRLSARCYELSDGLFDITSGVLRQAWSFNGQTHTPDTSLINSLLPLVGWDKVELRAEGIRLLPGMEIDLGGIGKEYAVDKVATMLSSASDCPVLVSFGGDLCAVNSDRCVHPWFVGIEEPEQEGTAIGQIRIHGGAVATSGDARRFCLVNGMRLGHILNPRTGWPVANAPRSVTVVATHCTEAGLLATMAILLGEQAESFLQAEGLTYHCVRN